MAYGSAGNSLNTRVEGYSQQPFAMDANAPFLGVRFQQGIPMETAGNQDATAFSPAFESSSGSSCVVCCICGTSMPANPTGKCSFCLTRIVDVTEGIERNLVMPFCRHCNRYQRPPWLPCEWESRELLALCLKKIKGLQGTRKDDVRLVNASFLYTEPHSRRIKVKLTLQKEVTLGAVVEQDCVVEFIIQPTQCDECKRAFTPHTWTAVVQVRQKVPHKRSLMYLEQLILKHQAHEKVLKIVEAADGLDFQFASRSDAQRFTDFVGAQLPTRLKSSKQLVSHDSKSNTVFNKHTFSLDVCPVCKDDLVYIPPKIAKGVYGGVPNFMLCTRVTRGIQLVDPFTLRGVDIASDKYWRHPLLSVLDIEPVDMRSVATAATAHRFLPKQRKASPDDADNVSMISVPTQASGLNGARASQSGLAAEGRVDPHCLVDVEIARVSDFGVNDTRFQVRSHLGAFLRVGDYCLGYDISTINLNGGADEFGLEAQVPAEAILVRKSRRPVPGKRRAWVLQRLPITKPMGGTKTDTKDLEEFKTELEEDSAMRKDVNLWKDPRVAASTLDKEYAEDPVKLCELLQGLTLEDNVSEFE